jgi:hypothetical protein
MVKGTGGANEVPRVTGNQKTYTNLVPIEILNISKLMIPIE